MLKPEILFAKKRRLSLSRIVCAGLVLLSLFVGIFSPFGISFDSYAASDNESKTDAQIINENIHDILIWKINTEDVSNLQDLITSFLRDPISGTNQNYILSTIDNPHIEADVSSYMPVLANSLDKGISSEEGIFPTSLQKSIATLKTCIDYSIRQAEDLGKEIDPELKEDSLAPLLTDAVLDAALYHSIGEKGIMSYIYGLYMLDTCGFENASMSRDEVIDALLLLQCDDGGYTLSGDVGDTDVTAMTLQVLAPSYLDPSCSEDLQASVERSISFLSSIQEEGGDYASFGTACSESTAQVVLALDALDINPLTDDRFIENGNTLLDGLLIYRQEDGGFSHASGLPSNDMASSQVLEALTAMLKYTDDSDTSAVPASEIKPASKKFPTDEADRTLLRILIPVVIAVISLSVGIIITVRRKKIIHLISSILIAAALIGLFFELDIRSRSSFENAKSAVILSASEKNTSEISFLISAETVSDEEIYPIQTLYVAQDSTVFEILCEVCRLNNIQLDYEKNSVYGLAYIKGINSIYEYDHGDLSGWMYRVNGELPNIGCGYYKVKDGDVVEILYSTNIGRDLTDD